MLAEQESGEYMEGTAGASALARAILQTLYYADLFDFPMTLDEITRYLIGAPAAGPVVARALAEDPALQAAVESAEGFYFLAGRGGLVAVRRARDAVSAALWQRTRRYIGVLQWFPFVRMVAITGALAMDNVGQRVDIDLLVAAVPGRVWICRRFLILGVRLARLFGDELCPNYVVDTRHLQMRQQDLYTAHELVQMVPLAGYPLYRQMLAANRWAGAYLPNATPRPAPRPGRLAWLWRSLQALVELPFALPLFHGWEHAELTRMQHKLAASRATNPEIVFTSTQCKGHLGAYRATVLDRFMQRVASSE